jgi:hypothetical protein
VNTLTKRIVGLSIVAGVIGAAMTVVGPATIADASTPGYKTISGESSPVYSWVGSTLIAPKMVIPSGYAQLSGVVTVKQGSKTLATNKGYYLAKPGTYTAYSTVKYAKKIAVKTTKTVTSSTEAEHCTIVTATHVAGSDTQFSYTGACTGTVVDAAGVKHAVAFNASWTDEPSVGTPMLGVGDTVNSPRDSVANAAVTGKVSYPVTTTTYKYGTPYVAKTARTFKAVAVKNTSVMTKLEANVINYGHTLAYVTKVVGGSGTVVYNDGTTTVYAWTNTDHGHSYVAFQAGRAIDFAWDTV